LYIASILLIILLHMCSSLSINLLPAYPFLYFAGSRVLSQHPLLKASS
jgi:hypothetical protein